MKPERWVDSLNCAIEGILWAVKNEPHLRYHFCAGLAVLLLALFFQVSALEFFLLVLAAVLVIFAELMNTAIEALVDLATEDYHELAKRAKDVAAGAVLVTSVGAIILGYLVLSGYLFTLFGDQPTLLTHKPQGTVPIGALMVVIILVILLKARFNYGTPLHGGMPSGHSAIAFSIATSVVLSGTGLLSSALVILLASLVSQSRLLLKIHSVREVIFGAILGILVTLAVSLIFS